MNPSNTLIKMYDLHPTVSSMKEEVLTGLRMPQKTLSPKYFYDKTGSQLFDEITKLAEYYPTRTEISLLKACTTEIGSLMGTECCLIEFGSGSSTKIRTLLHAIRGIKTYIPIDISKEHLYDSAAALARLYPHLNVIAICADYCDVFQLPFENKAEKKVAFFPGSTVGNFEPDQARQFLQKTAAVLQKGDGMLIGVDLKKDPAILHTAYNDSRGITAAFNQNILRRINRELKATFDLSGFVHEAFCNEDEGRIEMHLKSTKEQTVNIGEETIRFTKGETIHTENSYKYTVEEFQQMAEHNGFKALNVWADPLDYFSLHYLEVM